MCPRTPARHQNLQVEVLVVQNLKVVLHLAVHQEPQSVQNLARDQDLNLDHTRGDIHTAGIHDPIHTEGGPAADLTRLSIGHEEGAAVIHQCPAEDAMQGVERAMCRRNTEEH